MLSWSDCFSPGPGSSLSVNYFGMETFMAKIKSACIVLMLLGSVPTSSVWAGRGHGHGHGHGHHHHGHHHHNHGHHHHHRGGWSGPGLALGLGLLGYGLGYYSRGPSYPPAYGYPPAGYAPNYGYGAGYGYAPAVAAPPAPSVYIQQQEVIQVPSQGSSNYWHYCRNPEGYYPYVKNCPNGWLQVAPQPGQ